MTLDGKSTMAVGFTAATMSPRTYSLVVGADGVGSKVRDLTLGPLGGPNCKVVFPGWGYWFCTVPAAVCAEFLKDAAMREVWARGQRFGGVYTYVHICICM
jgi:2-polyprenyl-6-methoxyphenol hydroxylase-like FAD-dependent oxidoreductase